MSRREGGQGDDVFDKSLEETESGDYDYLEKILGALFGQFFGYFWDKTCACQQLSSHLWLDESDYVSQKKDLPDFSMHYFFFIVVKDWTSGPKTTFLLQEQHPHFQIQFREISNLELEALR